MSTIEHDASTLREALEREHRAIDGGIEEFLAHVGTRPQTTQLHDTLVALRRHIWLEEEFLFPPLREAGIFGPVLVMLAEHRDLWSTMALLEQQIADGIAPEELRSTASTLLAQLDRHNTKEEPILYSQADTTLSEDARAELHDFIAHEELPPGWSCLRP